MLLVNKLLVILSQCLSLRECDELAFNNAVFIGQCTVGVWDREQMSILLKHSLFIQFLDLSLPVVSYLKKE